MDRISLEGYTMSNRGRSLRILGTNIVCCLEGSTLQLCTAFQADAHLTHLIRRLRPRLLTVQPSRLRIRREPRIREKTYPCSL